VVSALVGSALTQLESTATPDAPVTPVTPTAPVIPATTPAVVPLPALGAATAWGCGPAVAYLQAYGAPGFVYVCPGADGGHQATTTCISIEGLCEAEKVIIISDPCPAAYMNEASNSLVLSGLSRAPIDPYGQCH
jgi:hypothetical protein